MNNIDNLKELIKNNNGWITTRIVNENNIHRQYLKQLVNDNIIEKVSRGLYVYKEK